MRWVKPIDAEATRKKNEREEVVSVGYGKT